MLEVCDLLLCLYFKGECSWQIARVSEETLDFETSLELLLTMGTSQVGLNALCIVILFISLWGQGVECVNLNVTGPHNLREWHHQEVWLCWSRYGLVEGSVSLWGQALRIPMLGIPPSVSADFLLHARCSSLSSSTAPCIPARRQAPYADNSGWNRWNCQQATPVKCFPL